VTLNDELLDYARATFGTFWTIRDGQKVPEDDEIASGRNDAVRLNGTVLYADLKDSTRLVKELTPEFAAEVYKSYVYCAARIIRNRSGSVTAYDGDRVMGVFVGSAKSTNALRAALEIEHAVENVIQPALNTIYGTTKYTVKQKCGVDTSPLLVANSGIRGNTDLVWIGPAANVAAKLSSLDLGYSTYTTQPTLVDGGASTLWRDSSQQEDMMWDYLGEHHGVGVFGTRYHWKLS